MTTKTRLVTVSAALAIGVLVANVANANVITLYGDYTNNSGYYDAGAARGSVECSWGTCYGLLSSQVTGTYDSIVPDVSTANGFSDTSADLFYLASHSEVAETAFLNAVINPDVPTGVRTSVNGAPLELTFRSAATYILLKIGADPNIALIWNPSGQELLYKYSGLTGSGAGLSHIMSFGGPVTVPEPETLALLLPGIAAMALGMRRRKVAVAA